MRAGAFGDDAAQYDRARPSYPAALVDDLMADSPVRVVDVGCGTGIASRLFVARGCEVIGVEADARMAEVASAHGLRVEVSPFESWTPPAEPFDLLVSGQAWHWVDPVAGAAAAARVLRGGGRFAAFWNNESYEPEVLTALEDAHRPHAEHLIGSSVALGSARGTDEALHHWADIDALAASGAFGQAEVRTYEWDRDYSSAEIVDVMETHSGHRTLPPPVLAAVLAAVRDAIDGFGGRVQVHYTTSLVTALRR